jgi:hypothetical protein
VFDAQGTKHVFYTGHPDLHDHELLWTAAAAPGWRSNAGAEQRFSEVG